MSLIADEELFMLVGDHVTEEMTNEMGPVSSALNIVSLGFASTTIILQLLQFSFMIKGAPYSILFELVWNSIALVYPVGAVWVLLAPVLEANLLQHMFWIVNISAVIEAGIIMFNWDLIKGKTATHLVVINSSLVSTLTVINTWFSSITVIIHTVYCQFAVIDYKE